jgi:hypothetical protein
MNGLAWIIGGTYFALAAYILYQAVTLDRYRRWNDELMQENAYLQPPF